MVAAIDEESLGIATEDEFRRQVDPEIYRWCDLLFAQGDSQAEALQRFPGIRANRVAVTGNPRTDILTSSLAAPLRSQGELLRKKFGDFLLVNTNFGSVNPARTDTLGAFELFERVNAINRRNSQDIKEFFEWCAWGRGNLHSIVALIAKLHTSGFPWSIIVRPHPSERLSTWQRLLAGQHGIHVVREGDHLPWTAAARALLHTGSTTGLEAFLLGTPSVSLRLRDDDWGRHYLSNQVNRTARTIDDAVAKLNAIVSGHDNIEQQRLDFDRHLQYHLNVVRGRLAATAVVDALAELARRIDRPAGKAMLRRIHADAGSAPERKIENATLDLDTVMRRLVEIEEQLELPRDVCVEGLGPHVVEISRSTSHARVT